MVNGDFELNLKNIKKHYQSYNYRWDFEIVALSSDQSRAWSILESAQENYKNREYEKSLNKVKPLAEQGYPVAQILLGNMYERGRGVPKDYSLAIKWYMKAYRQGDVSAEYWLNLLHKKGTAQRCKPKLIKKILLPLSIAGYPPAMKSICAKYATGSCYLPQDFQKAREWCDKAAKLGITEANELMDILIPAGEKHAKTRQKRQEAIKHLEQKASQGDLNAQVELGMVHFYGDNLGDISKNHTIAAQWFRKPAENGNTEAQIYLGMVYQEQGNPKEAERWYRIPAENGDARAQLNLAMLYADQEKMSEALELIKSSAQKNYSMAHYILGSIYEDGIEEIPQDYVQAYMWYWLACTDTDLECDTIPLFSGPKSLGKKMTESEITRAKNLANKWLRESKQQ